MMTYRSHLNLVGKMSSSNNDTARTTWKSTWDEKPVCHVTSIHHTLSFLIIESLKEIKIKTQV